MFKVFNVLDYEWDEFVKGFKDFDIYYDRSYFKSLENYLKVKIFLLAYSNGLCKIGKVVQLNDISDLKYFKNSLKSNAFFDAETPYGYGGVLAENANNKNLNIFFSECKSWFKKMNVVSEFIRFNPLLENERIISSQTKTLKMKSTIFMNLKNKEQIMQDINSKNRNMIRKAIKNGVEIKIMQDEEKEAIIPVFIDLYKKTMDRNNASDFYYFTDKYFSEFFSDMKGKYKIFYAQFKQKIIAASIMIYNNKILHYYLSGSNREYAILAPNNLLLYTASLYGVEKGMEKFHLGGGVSDNDNLFGFKKQFNEKGTLPFYVGREIFDQTAFENLVRIRKDQDEDFDLTKNFLIKYRQED